MNLAKLEEYFGTSLLNRDRAFRFLTPAGERLYQNGNRIQQELSGLKWHIQQPHLLTKSALKIGCSNAVSEMLLAPVLIDMAEQHAEIFPQIQQISDLEAEELILKNKLDCALRIGCVRQSGMITYQLSLNSDLVYFEGPVYQYAIFGAPKFKGESWQNLPFATIYSLDENLTTWNDLHYPRQLKIVCGSLTELKELCVQGSCCAFLPTHCIQRELDQGQLVEITAAPFHLSCHPYLITQHKMTLNHHPWLDMLEKHDFKALTRSLKVKP